tara:strand:- start:545 stop:1669 length:1125 start_codon:yes stop_codon:yes gene_type:complete
VNSRDTIRVELDERAYDIFVENGLIYKLGKLVLERFGRCRTFIITDQEIGSHWLTPVCNSFSSHGLEVTAITLPAGESTKCFHQLEQIVNRLLDAQIGRDGIVIALGGGVIGDLAGFTAAITLRGVDVVQVPTTLLAQVDSSVGGKTAINTRQGKNLVGSFYQPSLVVIDPQVLETLPARQLLAGYAEVLKYGLIKDRQFFEWLEENGQKILRGDAMARQNAIVQSCRIKAGIVESDETEQNQRAILNFGHTFGHALEAEAGFDDKLLHGEAVSIGMMMAMELSKVMGLLQGQEVVRVRKHIADMGLPVNAQSITKASTWKPDSLIEHMRHDKKVLDGRMRFVLAKEIGKSFVTADVQERDIYGVVSKSLEGLF